MWKTVLLLCTSVFCAVVFADRSSGLSLTHDIPTVEGDIEESLRLPKDTIPIHYNIRIQTAVHEGNSNFSGTVDIHLHVVNTTDKIIIHNRSLTIESAILRRVGEDDWSHEPSMTYDNRTEHLIFQSNDDQFRAGEDYVLKITYNGELQSESVGFFRKYYRDENNIRRYIAATQFEPTRARMAFPCYDEPSLKATFSISLVHNSGYNAVSNMPRKDIQETDPTDPGFVVSSFEETPLMSTYLVAFAVTDFKMVGNELLQIFARPNAINDTEFALIASEKILQEINSYLNISYWDYMPKLGHIAIPDRGMAAMENWGLVTYGESVLLFDPSVNTFRTREDIVVTIAHESAHQWFGNLVTHDWWKYLWLNEGFATFYGYYGAHLAYPEEQFMDLFQIQAKQEALADDASETTRPMNWNAESTDAILDLFDTVAYEKSACVIDMLRHVHGESFFREGLQKYLLKRVSSTATPEDLYDALQQIHSTWDTYPADMTVRKLMDNWTNAPGYPVVSVRRIYGGSLEAILSQERFLSDKQIPGSHIWYIPYVDPVNSTVFSWLTTKAAKRSFPINDDKPLILNGHKNFGFYRVNYDTRNWQLITAAWMSSPESIDPSNRAQLIDDAFALARADLLDFSIVLRMLTGLKNDFAYHPWAAADKVLNYLHDRLRGTDEWDLFGSYAQTLISSNYRNLQQFDVLDDDETLTQKYLREQILSWACRLQDSDCLQRTQEMFREMVGSGKMVHPDISPVVYCYGLRNATDDEFVRFYQRMFNSSNEAERALIIKALGCSHSKIQLDAYLTTSIGSGVGTEVNYQDRERLQVVTAVYSASRIGVDALIDFLDNWDMADDFIYWLEQPAFDNAIASIATRTNTEPELARLKNLFTTVGALAPDSVVEAALETAQANIEWHNGLERYIIVDFFERFLNEQP